MPSPRSHAPDELVAIIRALDVEMGQIPVDWAAMTYFEGCGVAIAEMTARHPELTADALSTLDIASTGIAARHPELSPEAVTTLRWDFSYGMR